ncbi:MAG: hypothetical protein CVT95_07200, partial [Bacteroidetes bacterium HGW-Bacteroidetes-12]
MIFKTQKKTIYIVLALLIIGCTTGTNKDNDSLSTGKVEDKNIEINGINHYFKIIGTGEPILVLHGGPGLFSDYLISSFEGLAEGYQFIFYDQRGSGKTDFPKDTASISIDNFVEDIEAIRKHLKIDKITLSGHSWGGLLALFYAKKYPDNLNKLILIAPGPSNSEYYEKTLTNMQQKRKEEDTKE